MENQKSFLSILQSVDAFFPIVRGATTLEKAMRTENAVKNMELTAEQVFRLAADFMVH